jgi:hypothetical protein
MPTPIPYSLTPNKTRFFEGNPCKHWCFPAVGAFGGVQSTGEFMRGRSELFGVMIMRVYSSDTL